MSLPSIGADRIDAERIQLELHTRRFGRSLRVLDATESTNDDARKDALAGAVEGHVVVADHQTRGRGSQGRAWESPAGTDLYVSIVTRPNVALHALPKLTLAVGLGVSDAVDAQAGVRSRVKWPNDVWVDGKKVAGILIEASTTGDAIGAIILGIGLNVNRTAFSPEVAPLATSLRLANAKHQAGFDRVTVLCALLAHVEAWVDRFIADGPDVIVRAVDERLALRGQRVTHEGVEGTLLGLAPSGAIRIETARGIVEHVSGRLLPAP